MFYRFYCRKHLEIGRHASNTYTVRVKIEYTSWRHEIDSEVYMLSVRVSKGRNSWKKNFYYKILNRDPVLRTLCNFYATLRKRWIFDVKKIISRFYRHFCRVLLYKYLILRLLMAEALRRGYAVFYGIFFPLWRGEAKVRHYVGATKG